MDHWIRTLITTSLSLGVRSNAGGSVETREAALLRAVARRGMPIRARRTSGPGMRPWRPVPSRAARRGQADHAARRTSRPPYRTNPPTGVRTAAPARTAGPTASRSLRDAIRHCAGRSRSCTHTVIPVTHGGPTPAHTRKAPPGTRPGESLSAPSSVLTIWPVRTAAPSRSPRPHRPASAESPGRRACRRVARCAG